MIFSVRIYDSKNDDLYSRKFQVPKTHNSESFIWCRALTYILGELKEYESLVSIEEVHA